MAKIGFSAIDETRDAAAGPPPSEVERLVERAEAREQLLAALIHDLRNPLNIVLTWTHLLREGMLDAETTLRALDTVRRNAELQARMLSNFVDYQRLQEERAELDFTDLDLPPLVTTALGGARNRALEKPIHLDVDLEPGPQRVRADAEWLGRALSTLIEQAIDATPVAGRLQLRLRASDREVRLELRRTGAPYQPDELQRFFDPVGSSGGERSRGNLNLEVALVKHVARLHGGRVTVENTPEADGAVYSLSLPLVT